jgi:hypothetical protein
MKLSLPKSASEKGPDDRLPASDPFRLYAGILEFLKRLPLALPPESTFSIGCERSRFPSKLMPSSLIFFFSPCPPSVLSGSALLEESLCCTCTNSGLKSSP